MSVTVDSLDIQIQSSAKKAVSEIDSLVSSLGKLSSALKIDTSRLEKIGSLNFSGIKKIEKATKDIGKVKKSADGLKDIRADIDTKDFDSAVESLQKKFRDVGTDFKFSGNFSETEKEIQNIEKKLSKLYERQDEMRDLGKSVSSEGFIKLQRDIALSSNKLDILKSHLESMKKAGEALPNLTITRGGDSTKRTLSEYQKDFEELKSAIKDIEETFGGLSNIPKGMLDNPIEELGDNIKEMKKEFPDAKNEIARFEEELKRLKNISAQLTREPVRVNIDTGDSESKVGKISDETKEFIKSLEKLEIPEIREDNLGKLYKSLEKAEKRADELRTELENGFTLGEIRESAGDSTFRRIQKQIAIAEKTAEALRKKISQIGGAAPETTAPKINGIRESLKGATLSAEEFEQYLKNLKIPEINETNLGKLRSELEKTEKKLETLKVKMENWSAKGINPDSTKFRNLREQIAETEKRVDALRGKINDVGEEEPKSSGWSKLSRAATIASKSFSAIGQGIKRAADSVKKIERAFSGLLSVIKKISSSIAKLFSDMTHLAAIPTKAVISSIKGISGAFSRLKSESSGIQTAAFGLKELAKTAAGIATVGGLANFGKQAIELGSDITEVENVVDTAFGAMADKAYKFAETASKKFGLSELAAKQYSGTMMAMLKSSGVAQKEASDMSINLAALAGDIASFYNIDAEDAFKKLRSGIAGQTAPLKQLGINMNIANLEAYAMSQGIRKSYNEMSLAEKTTLRYNYIIAKTGDAQGDFARTAGTWANQVRLLRLNFQSLSAIIGQGLIAAILPAVKALNKLMEKLTQAAKKFRDFMYVLFGKKIESPTRGIVDDMADTVDYTEDLSNVGNATEDIADGMNDAADGANDLTASTKKLQKQLATLSFDELNQLAGKLDDIGLGSSGKKEGGGSKDSNLGDLGIGDMSGMFDDLYDKKEIEPINKWAAAIRKAFLDHDWEGLGKIIAKMINKGLRKIYGAIVSITPKVESALKAFAKVFNSFVKWLDWDTLGRTIGAGINLIARSINALTDPATGVNFVELGKNFSVGFRGLVDEIDWKGLGNAFGNYFMIAWRIFEGFVDDMWRKSDLTGLNGWQELGRSLGDGINGLFEKIDLGSIGTSLAMGLNGVFLSLKNFTETIRWGEIADNISNGLTNAIEGIHPVEAAVSLGMFVTDLLGAMLQVAEETPWYTLGEKIGDFLINIPWRTIIGQAFGIIENVFGGLIGGLGDKILGQLPQVGNAFAVGFNTIFAKLGDLAKSDKWGEAAENISNGLNEMIHKVRWADAGKNLSDFVKKLLDTILQVAEETDWEALGEGIGNFLSSIDWGGIFTRVFDIAKESIGGIISGFAETSVGKVATGLMAAFGLMELTGIGLSVGNSISKELTGKSIYKKIFDAVTGEGGVASTVKTLLETGFSGIFSKEGILASVSGGATSFVTKIGEILSTIGSVVFSPTGLLIGGIALGAALIITNWDSVSKVFADFWNNILVPLGEFVSTVFARVWSDILSPALEYLGETVLPVLSETIGNLWNNVLVPFGSFLSSTFGPGFATLGKIISELWKNVLVPVAHFVGTGLAGAFEIGAAIFNNVVIPSAGAVAKAFQFLGEHVLKPLSTFVGGVFASTLSEKFKGIGDAVKRIKKIFEGLIEFVSGALAGDWEKAWRGIRKVFDGVWKGLSGVVKKPINAIIGFINKMVEGMATGVNDIAKMLNNLKIDIPDWVPGIGGGKLGFNIPTWKPGKIPYLEQGGVLRRGQIGILEGNGAEAVVPLERNRKWISKVSEEMARNNYAYSANVDEEAIASAVEKGVAMALMNNIQNLRSDSQQPINITVKLQNDEAIARAAIRGQKSIDYRTNPTPQFG